MRMLRMGSQGPAVALLQLALNRAGAGELETDGVFGVKTEAALRRFQRETGLNPDGAAGRETHRALTPWYTGYLVHKLGGHPPGKPRPPGGEPGDRQRTGGAAGL